MFPLSECFPMNRTDCYGTAEEGMAYFKTRRYGVIFASLPAAAAAAAEL